MSHTPVCRTYKKIGSTFDVREDKRTNIFAIYEEVEYNSLPNSGNLRISPKYICVVTQYAMIKPGKVTAVDQIVMRMSPEAFDVVSAENESLPMEESSPVNNSSAGKSVSDDNDEETKDIPEEILELDTPKNSASSNRSERNVTITLNLNISVGQSRAQPRAKSLKQKVFALFFKK